MKFAWIRAGRRLAATVLLILPALAQAQSFPRHPVTMIVPYPAGGSLDTVGRPLAQQFEKATGQSLILENVGGAGGMIGADRVAKSAPDGYTLLLASNGQITLAPLIYKKVPYDPKRDFQPVAYLVNQTAVLYAGAKSPYKTFADLAAAIRKQRYPITFASSGTGSISHLAMELLAQKMHTTFNHVPYRGAAPALQDLAGGQVPLLFTFVGSAKPLTASGLIRPLAVAARHRLASLPNVPTFAELGYPGIEASVWIGLMAPRGTPQDRIQKIASVVDGILKQPGFEKLMADNNMEIEGGSIKAFRTMMAEDAKRWSGLAKSINLASN